MPISEWCSGHSNINSGDILSWNEMFIYVLFFLPKGLGMFRISLLVACLEDPNRALSTMGLFGRVAQYLAEPETCKPTYLGSRPRKRVLRRSSESQAT